MRDQILLSQARFSSLHTASGLNEIRSCGRAHESSETWSWVQKIEIYKLKILLLEIKGKKNKGEELISLDF